MMEREGERRNERAEDKPLLCDFVVPSMSAGGWGAGGFGFCSGSDIKRGGIRATTDWQTDLLRGKTKEGKQPKELLSKKEIDGARNRFSGDGFRRRRREHAHELLHECHAEMPPPNLTATLPHLHKSWPAEQRSTPTQ